MSICACVPCSTTEGLRLFINPFLDDMLVFRIFDLVDPVMSAKAGFRGLLLLVGVSIASSGESWNNQKRRYRRAAYNVSTRLRVNQRSAIPLYHKNVGPSSIPFANSTPACGSSPNCVARQLKTLTLFLIGWFHFFWKWCYLLRLVNHHLFQ